MRAGGCTVQQALTPEAATVVKQAVSLARRRGHTQVTPLHVANTMLASSTGLFRTACLRSQSHGHPLQCKALELCFNVALNRLPTSSSSPMLPPHSHHPSLSNALLAAFKRAQAHQRRGSVESQQQPLMAVKIEIEQLVISILDDPSVSRVMREAGFLSTQVKSNVEQAVASEIRSPPSNTPIHKPKEGGNLLSVAPSSCSSLGQFGLKPTKATPLAQFSCEDVMAVLESMVNRRRRSLVVLGECLASSEAIVRAAKERVDKGEAPGPLKHAQFVRLSPFAFADISAAAEVEQKLGEIRCLAKGCSRRGIILYLGDLRWVAEFRANSCEQERNYSSPVEHMILEIGKIVYGVGEYGRLWLVGIATYQTFMRCRIGRPSLETLWGLHPLPLPANSLGLSLSSDSDQKFQFQNGRGRSIEFGCTNLLQDGIQKQLTCCADCASKFQVEVQSLANSTTSYCNSAIIPSLPTWLQQYKEENNGLHYNDKESFHVRELCKKWNYICSTAHHQESETTLNFSLLPASSSLSPYDQYCSSFSPQTWQRPPREHHFWISDTAAAHEAYASEQKEMPNSASSTETMEIEGQNSMFKELNAENLKTLCKSLEEEVPWQKGVIPQIASTILQCRSRMVRRKGASSFSESKEDTWLLFLGDDNQAKDRIARALASLVFGSRDCYTSIGMSSFSTGKCNSGDNFRNKRTREETSCSYVERFADAVGNDRRRVFFLEDVEQIDYYYHLGIKNAIESGKMRNSSGCEVCFGDAIIILSCESLDVRWKVSSRASSRASSPPTRPKSEGGEEEDAECEDEEISPCVSLDLNLSFEDLDDLSFDDAGLPGSVDGRFTLASAD